jgi:hypothetical protein
MKTKHQQKQDTPPVGPITATSPSGVLTQVSPPNWYDSTYVPHDKRITYEQNPRPQFNYCDHLEIHRYPNPNGFSLTSASSSDLWVWGSHVWGYWCQVHDESLKTLAAVDLSSHVAEAWQTMRPSMDSGFNLPTFVRELKDIKRLPSLFTQGLNTLKGILNVARIVTQNLSLKNLKEVLKQAKERFISTGKDASGTLLNYSFGWIPTISDIKKMSSILKKVDAQFDELIRRAGKRQIRYCKRYVVINDYDSGYGTPVSGFLTSFRVRRKTDRCWVICRAEYSYILPDVSAAQLKLRAYLDAFGVNLDPRIIWDSIPFSFVIDWFVNVGKFLESLQVSALNIDVKLEDFTVSLTHEAINSLSARTQGAVSNLNDYHCGSYRVRRYIRQRVNPLDYVSPEVKSLTGMQTVLGTALLFQRLK